MEKYQFFLHRSVVCLLALLGLTSLFAAAITLPYMHLLADTRTWEAILFPLSLSLSILALCRMLCLFQKRELTKESLLSLLLLLVASALASPIKKEASFVFQDYIFPIAVGMTLPRVLLSLLPLADGKTKFKSVFFAVSLILHLLLCLFCLSSVFFFDPLSHVLTFRLTMLPLMLTSQTVSFFASRNHLTSYPTSLVMGLLPLCHILGIFKGSYYNFFPLFFGISLILLILDLLYHKKAVDKC